MPCPTFFAAVHITVMEAVLASEPGAVIKNAANPQSSPVPVIVRGILQAQGTAEQPIIFTAFEDDSDGYDSDGAAGTLISGGGENIQFLGATASWLQVGMRAGHPYMEV